VKPDRVWGGYRFDGDLLSPGAMIDQAALWPAPTYPRVPLLLECAGPEGGGRGHRRVPYLYILWRWDQSRGEWGELARVADAGRDWTADLGPIARRELRPRPVLVDPRATAARVMAVLEQELEPLDRQAQRVVLLAAYDQVAARVVEG
jgi:hypothetical protein